MTIRSFVNLIKREAGTLALILAALLVITAIINFTQPLRYEASNKLLIQQDINQFDPYNVFKINEYYNNLIKEIVHSETFFKQVIKSNYDINENYFGETRKEQIKTWNKTVDIVSSDVGTMKVKTYHPKPKEAKQILLATTDILINKNSNYQNLDNNVDIKIINQITTSNYPKKPNLILNFLYTIIIAIVISLLYIYYMSEKQFYAPKEKDKNLKNGNNNNDSKEIKEEEFNTNNNILDALEKNELREKKNKEKENNNKRKEEEIKEVLAKENYSQEDNDNKPELNQEQENNEEEQRNYTENTDKEKTIKEGEEVNIEEEIEQEADINNLFNK